MSFCPPPSLAPNNDDRARLSSRITNKYFFLLHYRWLKTRRLSYVHLLVGKHAEGQILCSGHAVAAGRRQTPEIRLHLLHAFLVLFLLRVCELYHQRTRTTLHGLRVMHALDGRYGVLFGRVRNERATWKTDEITYAINNNASSILLDNVNGRRTPHFLPHKIPFTVK